MKNAHLNSDNFVERGMQTFNHILKNKDVQVTAVSEAHVECQVSSSDIADAEIRDDAEADNDAY